MVKDEIYRSEKPSTLATMVTKFIEINNLYFYYNKPGYRANDYKTKGKTHSLAIIDKEQDKENVLYSYLSWTGCFNDYY